MVSEIYRRWALASLVLAVGFAVLLHFGIPLPVPYSALIALNLTAAILCGYDKMIAPSNAERVPERVFLGLALLGGTPGLLLGMNLFRHKTAKAAFQFKLVLILVAQIALVRWLTGAT